MVMLVVFFLAALVNAAYSQEFEKNSEDLIKEINGAQTLWKAAPNDITKKGMSYLKNLLGANKPKNITRKSYGVNDFRIFTNIPQSFDARQKWPQCKSISSIKDQGGCGACWAVATAAVASDRFCIQSNFKTKINLSAQNLMSCCFFCHKPEETSCQGGDPGRAWFYLKHFGITTGGDYGSNEGCQPYDVKPTGHGGYFFYGYTPICFEHCTNRYYGVSYSNDKYYGSLAYILPQSEIGIQREIMTNGPVVGTFDVYDDFVHYSTGIYTRVSSRLEGGHAIKVIGWGVEKGVKYWIAANSWGPTWGENGFFRIRRGNNECNFEDYVTAGQVRT